MFGARVIPVCDAAFRASQNEKGLQAFANAVISEQRMKDMALERIEQMRTDVKLYAAIRTKAGMPKFSNKI